MRNLLLSILIVFVSGDVIASHHLGGEITAKQINGLDYKITATMYRHTLGSSFPGVVSVSIKDVALQSSYSITLIVDSITNIYNNVEQHVYSAQTTFTSGGIYEISYITCCRNNYLVNMTNPSSEQIFLSTLVSVLPSANSTPVFLNNPAVLAQKNAPMYYNPLPFDADGDSLVWSLDTPHTSTGGGIVNGYYLPVGAPANPMTINSSTGEITWTPDSSFWWQSAVKVVEYRNGSYIGEINRDMVFIIVDDTTNFNRAIINTSGWPTNANGDFVFNVQTGAPFSLSVSVADADGDSLVVIGAGAVLNLSANAAQFAKSAGAGSVTGTFTWTPTLAQARTKPYILVFRVMEQHANSVFAIDRTVLLNVANFTSTQTEQARAPKVKVYPVPSTWQVFVEFQADDLDNVQFQILDLNGNKISGTPIISLRKNGKKNELNFDLSNGVYFLQSTFDNNMVDYHKLIIVK